jgi:hypothetical protein
MLKENTLVTRQGFSVLNEEYCKDLIRNGVRLMRLDRPGCGGFGKTFELSGDSLEFAVSCNRTFCYNQL